MFQKKITISKALFSKVSKAAQVLACSSVREFVETILEQEADRVIAESESKTKSPKDKEADRIVEKLKGLGYME